MFGFFRSHRNPVFFGGLSSSLNLPESLVLTAVPLEIPFGTLHARRVAPWILSDLRSCSEFPSLVAPRGCKEAYGMSISVEPAWVCTLTYLTWVQDGSRWFKLLDGGSACSNTCPGTGSKDRSNPLFSWSSSLTWPPMSQMWPDSYKPRCAVVRFHILESSMSVAASVLRFPGLLVSNLDYLKCTEKSKGPIIDIETVGALGPFSCTWWIVQHQTSIFEMCDKYW